MRLTRGKLQAPTLPRGGVDSNEWAAKLCEAEANTATMWVFPSQCDFHLEERLFSAAQCGPAIQRLLTRPSFVARQPFTPHFTIPHFLNPSHPALLCELSYAHSHSPLLCPTFNSDEQMFWELKVNYFLSRFSSQTLVTRVRVRLWN